MDKIASPSELQSELRRILDLTRGRPSRAVLASELRGLADRVANPMAVRDLMEFSMEANVPILMIQNTLKDMRVLSQGGIPSEGYDQAIDELKGAERNVKELERIIGKLKSTVGRLNRN